MISYFHLLFIISSSEPILHDRPANLLHLIGFRLAPLGLQIENFLHPSLGENVMVPTNAFLETQPFPVNVWKLNTRGRRLPPKRDGSALVGPASGWPYGERVSETVPHSLVSH